MKPEELEKSPGWFTEEELRKLTKGNARKIKILQETLKILNSHLNQFEGKEETNVFFNDGIGAGDKPLPFNSKVIFIFGNNRPICCYFREQGKTLEIQAWGAIRVLPKASNMIYIEEEK